MNLFCYSGTDPQLLTELESSASGCPIIGDCNPSEVIGLAHYSKDCKIQAFRRSNDFNWTRRVCDSQGAISAFTQLGDIKFNAIYVIRLGIGPTYRPRMADAGITKEYALGIPVNAGEFACIVLKFNEAARTYSAA